MKIDAKYYLDRDSDNLMTLSDVNSLAKLLQHEEGLKSDVIYDLIWVLSRHGHKKLCSAIDHYLLCTNHVMVVRLVLETLCMRWDCGEIYESYVMSYMNKTSWDEEEDVRVMAISCAGHVWRKTKSKDLLGKLWEVFTSDSEDDFIRVVAYQSLVRALIEDTADVPNCLGFNLERDVNDDILIKVKEKLDLV